MDKNRKIRNSDLPVPEKFYSFDVELLYQFKLNRFKCLFNDVLSVVYQFLSCSNVSSAFTYAIVY